MIDASPVAIICSDPSGAFSSGTAAAEQIFGYTAEEALGQAANLLPRKASAKSQRTVPARLERRNACAICASSAGARTARWSTCGPRPRRCIIPTARCAAWRAPTRTSPTQVRAEEQLERVAHYDQLTGLPNRLTLQKELGRLLAGDGCNKPTAIALFDLDGFKDVNDTLGHSTGDQLLIEVGHRLTEVAGQPAARSAGSAATSSW